MNCHLISFSPRISSLTPLEGLKRAELRSRFTNWEIGQARPPLSFALSSQIWYRSVFISASVFDRHIMRLLLTLLAVHPWSAVLLLAACKSISEMYHFSDIFFFTFSAHLTQRNCVSLWDIVNASLIEMLKSTSLCSSGWNHTIEQQRTDVLLCKSLLFLKRISVWNDCFQVRMFHFT